MTTIALSLNSIGGPESASHAALWLVDAAVKACVLLAVTGIAARLLRRRSAATVHRVWTLGFCGCLLIPAATWFAPLGTLPVVPNLLADRTELSQPVAVSATPALPVAMPVADFDDGRDSSSGSAIPHLSSAAVAVPVDHPVIVVSEPLSSAAALPGEELRTIRARWSWPMALLMLWLVGVAVCVSRSVWLQWSLWRVLRRCTSIESENWTSQVRTASQMLGLSWRVRLWQCAELRTPAVTGLFRTIVLLPDDAETWTPERRRLVLLHELGHAQRRDVLAHALARVVCALHWFNPLCWLGLSQMGKLRELACDDLVLTSGHQPVEYADALLDVARTYRHRELGMAVGMARRANVEDRIMAILDRARDRMLLTPRAARRWLVTTVAVVVLLGSLRLSTQAEPKAEPKSAATPAREVKTDPEETVEPPVVAKPDDDVRTMEVRIADEDGRPLEGATLDIGLWELDGKRDFHGPRNYVMDAAGTARVLLPRHLWILRLWPAKPGYVPEFINFAQGTHDEGRLIPDKYEFRLAKGTTLSGTVVDEDGKPIQGTKVEVRVDVDEPSWTTNPSPMISTWLTDIDFSNPAPLTDAEGRWSIHNAPEAGPMGDHEFRLKLTHDNYVRDTEWGELQKQQQVTTAMLRDGTAKIVLPHGVRVRGRIVDGGGAPVTGGLLVWNDDPYSAEGINETAISAAGEFETIPLAPGQYPLTVIAPGFMPVQHKVSVAPGMEPLQFQLQPGKKLTLKIVDQHGQPVPRAYVGIESWGKSKAIFNHDHPNVPDSGIPRQADEHGIYLWDWAPADPVTYYISSKGHVFHRDLTLIAGEAEHVITLPQNPVAEGNVTDAQTGAPVPTFRLIPVRIYAPQFYSTVFQNAVPGKGGRYIIQFPEEGGGAESYRLRIEAQGYRTIISERTFGVDDGRVTADFMLEPASARRGKVVDAQGAPVQGAEIFEGTPSSVPMMRDGRLEYEGQTVRTSEHGTFSLLATSEPVRIRVVHESGFAEVLRQPDEEIGTLELQPWARVSGRLIQDGQPVAEQWVTFTPLPSRGLGEARFQDGYSAQTDAAGQFTFERLPPGLGAVRTQLGPWRDSPLTSSEAVPLVLAPGEQRELVLGGRGITITGHINATGRGDTELNKNWSLNYLIRRDSELPVPADYPTLDVDPSAPVEGSWYLKPQFYSWLAARPNYFVKPSPDGDLRIHGVTPGRYDLVLRLYEQPAGCLVETIGEQVVSIVVTDADVAAGKKDLGTIDVACRVGPRIGENMQAYKIVDATGRERTIQELQGGYVVLHVWASWCAPCLVHMAEIQSAVAEWNGKPMTVVGLNVDADRSPAQSLVRQHGWNWAQMYLGDKSDMARQLAISTVPTYYLIGPDGKLAASSNEWSAIREALDAASGKAK